MSQQIVAIDSQKLESISACSRLFDYKFNKHYRLINTPDYLERGGLIHEMLCTYYKLRKHRSRWIGNRKSYQDIVSSCVKVGRYFGNKMQLDIAEVEYTIEIFQQYADLWENDGWDNIISIEQVASKVLYESSDLIILYEGKIDLVLKLGLNIIPVDHKHSQSRRDPNELSNQFKGYCWLFGVENFLVNEIGFQKTIKPVDKMRRHVLSFTSEIISEWVESVIYYTKLALEWERMSYYPPNYSGCDKFSGCEFKDVCKSQPGEYRLYKINKEFREEKWDIGEKHL